MAIDLEYEYRQLEDTVKQTMPHANIENIRRAYDYSHECHGDQLRKSGDPYISHPLAAAKIIAEMGLDEESVISALLHDCIEDTGSTHEEIEKLFGKTVAEIVEGVTKLTRVTYTSKEEEQMENFRKMLLAMAKDIRVIIIKLADRLHNMRTLEYHNERKQREKALETMEIYAPIAHRLGMQRFKWELEDLSIKYLDPIGYEQIYNELQQRKDSNRAFFEEIQEKITNRLKESNVHCKVYGRIKHIYSIYRKMYTQNKTFDEVLDLYAFRVIVDTIGDCYNVMGYIHDMFKPIPGHIKDYIGTPKPNMYQSLHTTVIGTEGVPFEVQIRTAKMHETAEYGIAAHWKYKQGVTAIGDEEKFAWIRRLLETQQETGDAQDFFKEMKTDMFSDEVFVFTPHSDVVNLPAGSTPIDFAYNIHSAIGNRMVGAKVNGKIVPFTTILQNGDIVEVMTSKTAKGPSRDWLNVVKSSEARNKIRQWFKKEKREENIEQGRSMLDDELRRVGITLHEATNEENSERILKKLAYTNFDDMFAAIGYGGASAHKAANKIKDELRIIEKTRKKEEEFSIAQTKPGNKIIKPVNGVVVSGLDNCLVKFSRCCTPVPGDEIAGFITRGFGVSVHRKDCHNYLHSIENTEESGRWVEVNWAPDGQTSYTTTLHVIAKERSGLLMDLAVILNSTGMRLSSFTARDIGNGLSTASVTLDVKNTEELRRVMTKLSGVRGVVEVNRNND